MNNEIKQYTISVFTENKAGLLMRVVMVFTRRHINIESLTTSQSSIEGIFRFTIVVNVTEEQVKKLVQQLDKQVDVLKSFYYEDEDIINQEIALYKVPIEAYLEPGILILLMRKHQARILTTEKDFIVIEKAGLESETQALLEDLRQIGIYEFVRSGRVAIAKPMEQLNNFLKSMEGLNVN
ncbi:MAG: acetolactate synthase small subunit [Saprospiraceae bacterium]|nr:acetolactate synthase small subunit [Saprospiraceae bacterium]